MYGSLYVHVSVCLCVHMCMYTVSVNVCGYKTMILTMISERIINNHLSVYSRLNRNGR